MKKLLLLILLLPFIGFAQVIPAGTYKIGFGEPLPYTTLATAIVRVNSSGIGGSVTFLLKGNETVLSTLIINSSTITNVSPLTIKPDVGQNVMISGNLGNSNTTSAIIKIEGSDYVTIDGSNNNTDSRNLTISNTSTINYNNAGQVHSSILWIANKTNSDAALNNTIKNVNFTGANVDFTSSTSVGIVISGVNNMETAESISNSNTIISNNLFTKMKFGIWTLGGSSLNQNLTIDNNIFGSSTNSNSVIVYSALKLSNVQNSVVKQNSIIGMNLPSNTTNVSGLYLYNKNLNSTISLNKISNIKNTGNGRARGIDIDIDNSIDSNLIISNNFISDVTSNTNNSNDSDNTGNGIYLTKGRDIKIYYNTVVLNQNQNSKSSTFYIATGSQLNIRNNIFGNRSTTGIPYAIYSNVASSAFTDIDYNDYYATTIGYLGSDRTMLANWQAGTTKDAYSKSIVPSFVSLATADLHLQSITANDALKAGTSISVTTDIDGETRAISPDKPYMGADEIVCLKPTITKQPIAPSATCSGSGSQILTVEATGAGLTYQWQKNGVNLANGGVVSGSTTATLTLINPTTAVIGSYTVIVSGSCAPAVTSNPVTVMVSTVLSAPKIGTITQPTCSTSTGSVLLSGLPTESWVLTTTSGNIVTTGSTATTTIPGLVAGTYSYTVANLNNRTGLRGEYFNTMDLSGSPVLTRTDGTVNFDWGNGSPDNSINIDGFSARWSGFVQPQFSESYVFSTDSDDGIRLWVNGVQIINNWTNHGTYTDNSIAIPLIAGQKYTIVLEYFENGGGAVSRLSWSSASRSKEIIPQSRLFQIDNCTSPSSLSVVVNAQPLTPTAPIIGTITQPTCSTATASVVLNGLPTGSWVLTRTPGNVITTGSTASATVAGLSPGTYNYSVATSNNIAGGLKGEYYNNINLTGSPVLTRTDGTVNFNWGNGSPDSSIGVDNFSVRWSGLVQAVYSQEYTFSTNSDDGIRLSINGVQIINNWSTHGPTVDTGKITLVAGEKYSIVLEYFENGGGAVAELSWSSSSQSFQIIPQSQLFQVDYCTSPLSQNVVINSQPVVPTAPTIGTITQPTCAVQTGSVVLNGLPTTSGTWTIGSNNATTGLTGLSGTTATTTISGLTPGATYTFTVSNGSCASVASSNVVVTALNTTIYNGTTWSNGTGLAKIGTVTAPSTATINISANADLCSCTVSANTNVVVNSGITLKLQDKLVVNASGSLIFENNASLVQINDGDINSGIINYKRYTTKVKRYDFTYWSSPVAGQTLYNLSPLTLGDKYYGYNSAAGGYEIYYNGDKTMDAAIGYLVRAPQTFDIDIAKIDDSPVFKGKPNNGKIILSSLLGDNVYLLGNPYPSPLDADQFLNKNATVLEGTLYFWTHNSGPNANYYTANDYASYNRTGGVATTPTKTAATTGGPAPTGEIASGQGFFAPTKAAGNVEYNNDMRLFNKTTTMGNSQFFKVTTTAKESVATTIEKSRVWLNLTNKEGAFKQALVGYISGATNDYDGAFDGLTFDANEFLDFYSINKGTNLSIQGRALPFEKKDTVALGYRSAIKGEFQINIDQTDGALITQNVFLEDTDLKVLHDLKKRPYTFNTEVGTFNTRFVLRYVDKNAIGEVIPEPEIPADLNTAVVVSVLNGKITINSPTALIDKVIVYDLAGRKRYQNMKVLNKSLIVQNILSSHQVLVVKITLENGKIDTAKILY